MAMVSMARDLLRLNLRQKLTPTSSTATATPMVDMSMERGLLMLSQRPRLIPITTATPMVDMSMERGLLSPSQKPRPIPTSSGPYGYYGYGKRSADAQPEAKADPYY